jgi:hypothetical protein
VVLISNLRDEDDDSLLPALRLLQKSPRAVRQPARSALDQAAATPWKTSRPRSHSAAIEYRIRRDVAFRRLKQGNVVCLDVAPQRLALALVNQYLDVKRSGQL